MVRDAGAVLFCSIRLEEPEVLPPARPLLNKTEELKLQRVSPFAVWWPLFLVKV